ncbi:hypothetical protein I317_06402 [Kwoniella heveanensis CBS 569]|nr:hypothetical protein I317_06402 [Kwoniella heveanensis CBS 569]
MSTSILRSAPAPVVRSTLAHSVRCYAAKPNISGGNPNLVIPSDSRSDLLRNSLYPPDSYAPTSSSPTGNYHPDHLARLQAVIPSAEAHETIERAYQLFQRQVRQKRQVALSAKYDQMVEACDELEKLTNPSPVEDEYKRLAQNSGLAEGRKGGAYHRRLYEHATAELKQAERRGEQPRGKKSVEQRWKETRIEGLVPREAWVPVESKGKGWDYDWIRPGSERA